MPQPSQPVLLRINGLHGFSIAPNFRNPLKKDTHRLCVKSLSLDMGEFPHNVSKNKDVLQSLIPGIFKTLNIPGFSGIKIQRAKKTCRLLTVGAIFRFGYEHDFVF